MSSSRPVGSLPCILPTNLTNGRKSSSEAENVKAQTKKYYLIAKGGSRFEWTILSFSQVKFQVGDARVPENLTLKFCWLTAKTKPL